MSCSTSILWQTCRFPSTCNLYRCTHIGIKFQSTYRIRSQDCTLWSYLPSDEWIGCRNEIIKTDIGWIYRHDDDAFFFSFFNGTLLRGWEHWAHQCERGQCYPQAKQHTSKHKVHSRKVAFILISLDDVHAKCRQYQWTSSQEYSFRNGSSVGKGDHG